jgi:superkiller protein 3
MAGGLMLFSCSNGEVLIDGQGLNKFYERSDKWDGYGETLQKLMHLHSNTYVPLSILPNVPPADPMLSNDATKCAETVQRFVELQRRHGSSQQARLRFICTPPHNLTVC